MRVTLLRSARRRGIAGLALLAGIAACSEEGSPPVCENCEAWDQLTAGLGRFPEPHPSNAAVVAFSSIEKTPGAPDANRQSDEDLWVTWLASLDDATQNDPTRNPTWQITADELGAGDNFYPRWSPSGDEIAFVHTNPSGQFEIWRVSVVPPASPTVAPIVGSPERIASGRDPAWASADRLVFTRGDKLFSVDLSTPSPRGGYAEIQLSFDPPPFAAADDFVDRHPDFATDGGGVFNTSGRENVADLFVQAYEVDRGVSPPETLVTDAFILYQPPGATPAYPIFAGSDTLRTPVLLRSLPIGSGGSFLVGVRLDGRFLADTTRETYCDTTLTKLADLRPGDSDTLRYDFEVARGALRIQTMASNTTVFWTRADGLVDAFDSPISRVLVNAGETRTWGCLLSYDVIAGVPAPPTLERYLVTGTRIGSPMATDSTFVTPGDTVTVVLYAGGPGIDPSSLRPMPAAYSVSSASVRSRTYDDLHGASLASLLRAEGDQGTVWRIQLQADGADFSEILADSSLIQNPTISPETAGGFRYLAFVSNESGTWDLYVQRIAVIGSGASEVWEPDGEAVRVATPGSSDNLDCGRNVFHPRFVSGTVSGTLRLIVAMSDCPDNGFEDIGFDDDPWAIGEIRLWQVGVNLP
jgi:hypothetical protein